MFCSKCGSQVQDGAAYCPECGSKVVAVQDVEKSSVSPGAAEPGNAETPSPGASQPQNVKTQKLDDGNSSSRLMGCVAFVVYIIAAFFVIAVIGAILE